jgi:hypothetical protein
MASQVFPDYRLPWKAILLAAILIIIESFQRFSLPVYCWKTVEKPETDPQLL